MELHSLPVQVIAHVDEAGKVMPLRFRFEDEAREVHTARVIRVLQSREIPYVGVEAQVFRCLVREEEREKIYELKYAFRIHKWLLLRCIA